MRTRTALMIHGAGAGGWEWTVWQRVFHAAGWRVCAPDLQSAASGLEATTLADYEAQVRDWIASERPDALIGASLGGLLALRSTFAANRVLINPIPPAGLPGVEPLRKRHPARVSWQSNASLISTADALPDADPSTWHLAWRAWRDESGAVLNEASAGVSIPSPSGRILVIVSEADEDVPATTSRALARALNADLLNCPASSHVGPLLGLSAPDIASHVLAWLQTTT